MRLAYTLCALLAMDGAPLQCNWRPVPPEAQRTETAGESLWNLAARFQEQGNHEARATTLHFLVEKYPSSRFAQQAADELGIPRFPDDVARH